MSGNLASELSSGFLARNGLLAPADARRAADLIERLEADGIETIRFVFPDQHAVLRGKTIVRRAVGSVFQNGLTVPSSLLLKDTSHRTVYQSPKMRTGLTPDWITRPRLPWAW